MLCAHWMTPYQVAGDSCGDHSIWSVDEYATHYQQYDVHSQILSTIRPKAKQLQGESG